MKRTIQIIAGFIIAIVYIYLLEITPFGGAIRFFMITLVTVIDLIFGRRLPFLLRIIFTILIFDFGYNMCLIGRTMAPEISFYTIRMALYFFFLFAVLPAITLLRLWERKIVLRFIIAVLPVSFILALFVAGLEEHLFIRKYRETGVGPTARWTVSNHWLAYDPIKKKLYGSD